MHLLGQPFGVIITNYLATVGEEAYVFATTFEESTNAGRRLLCKRIRPIYIDQDKQRTGRMLKMKNWCSGKLPLSSRGLQ